jgi:hypothetical protein
MTWRLAKSLDTLRSQVNAAYPKRSKASDGTIGDARHSASVSDHNPNKAGVVTALDLTHDPANGVDIANLAKALIASKDSRIKYLIYNGKIVSGSGQKQPAWQERVYTGSNKHTRHIHISVKGSASEYDSTRAWDLNAVAGAPVINKQAAILKKGSKGPFVTELQQSLNTLGYGPLVDDGDFGAKTEAAVKAFQTKAGLEVDGWAGPRTLDAIGKALKERELKPKIKAAADSVPETAVDEVRSQGSFYSILSGLGGGAATAATAALSADWKTIAIVAGFTIVAATVLYLMRNRLIAAFREINAEAKQ